MILDDGNRDRIFDQPEEEKAGYRDAKTEQHGKDFFSKRAGFNKEYGERDICGPKESKRKKCMGHDGGNGARFVAEPLNPFHELLYGEEQGDDRDRNLPF